MRRRPMPSILLLCLVSSYLPGTGATTAYSMLCGYPNKFRGYGNGQHHNNTISAAHGTKQLSFFFPTLSYNATAIVSNTKNQISLFNFQAIATIAHQADTATLEPTINTYPAERTNHSLPHPRLPVKTGSQLYRQG